jgi:hypothetical protein
MHWKALEMELLVMGSLRLRKGAQGRHLNPLRLVRGGGEPKRTPSTPPFSLLTWTLEVILDALESP